jgi:hypothetical protein
MQEQGKVVVSLLLPDDGYCASSGQPGVVFIEGFLDLPTALMGAIEVIAGELEEYFGEFTPGQIQRVKALSEELSSWYGDFVFGGV